MTENVKRKLRERPNLVKRYLNCKKNTDLGLFQVLEKYTNQSFLKSFLTISIKINFLENVSLLFSFVIHVFHSYCLFSTK